MEVKWIPNKGESEFNVQEEAQMISDKLGDSNEELQNKTALLDEAISEFKKEYIE